MTARVIQEAKDRVANLTERTEELAAEHAVDLFRLFPHARLAVLPCTDHMALMTRAAWLAPMVDESLDAPMPKIEKPEALAV